MPESGTFTPMIVGGTTPGSNTYSFRIGRYIKNGNLVHCNIDMELSTKDTAMAGILRISGLPFASKNAPAVYQGVTLGPINGITLPTGAYQLLGFIQDNSTVIDFIAQTSAIGPFTFITASDIVNNASLHLTFDYEV